MDPVLKKFGQKLVFHFSQGGTLEQVAEAATTNGFPREISEVFPGMVLDATNFAKEIIAEERTVQAAVESWCLSGALRHDALSLIGLAISVLKGLPAEPPDEMEGDPATIAQRTAHAWIAKEIVGHPEDPRVEIILAIAQDYIDGSSKDALKKEVTQAIGSFGETLADFAFRVVDSPSGVWAEVVTELRRLRKNEPSGHEGA